MHLNPFEKLNDGFHGICNLVFVFMSKEYNPLTIIVAWWTLICLVANTYRVYHLGPYPPLWDNLTYQISGLKLARAFLESRWELIFGYYYEKVPIAYSLSLAISYLFFGFHRFAPYIVSMLFGAGCLLNGYFLALKLGARKKIALYGILVCAILPDFIFQNCLQTRNDYPIAFFISLSWIIMLQAFERRSLKRAFWAGLMGGLGAMFKLSAPGYLVWGFALILLLPVPGMPLSRLKKSKFMTFYAMGGVAISGWFYLPILPKTIRYYQIWSKMADWQSSQYQLHSLSERILFYGKNVFNVHLTPLFTLLLILLLSGALLYRLAKQREGWFSSIAHWLKSSQVCATAIVGLSAIVFLTLKGSLSSLGDVPVSILIIAVTLALISRVSPVAQINYIGNYLVYAFLSIGLIYSFAHLPIEKPDAGQDYKKFIHQVKEFRDTYGLTKSPFLQVFSHPVYNADTAIWAWHMNSDYTPEDLEISRINNKVNFIYPEDAKKIANKLVSIPFLILTETDATYFGGERFHTLNRLRVDINHALNEQGSYIVKEKISLNNGRFPMNLSINKNFSVFRPDMTTADGWTEWESSIAFFALKPCQLRWSGFPIRRIKRFYLVANKDKNKTIALEFVKILPDGRHVFESEIVVPPNIKTDYSLTAESDQMVSASNLDFRKLAFRNVRTEVRSAQ